MFNKLAAIVFSSTLIGQALGHGLLAASFIRKPGDAFKANCGEQMYYNVVSDPAGNIQQLNQLKQASFNAASCNLNLCKGLQFADVPASNIQTYTAGQVVPIAFDLRAPHDGVANMSVVDTATNTIIGSPLISFTDFASTKHPVPANQKNFEITLPDLGDKCNTAGECVLQFWWDARSIDQTYESCIDFTMNGSGSGSGSGSGAGAGAGAGSTPSPATTPATTSKTSTTPTASATPTPAPPAQGNKPATSAPAPAGCGNNVQARQVPLPASGKWARCGGIGWFGTTDCPNGLICYSYNDSYSACVEAESTEA